MILLEKGNRILGETVSSKLNHDPEEKLEPMDVKLCDFDDVSYRVQIEAESKNILQVSMNMPCYAKIADKGAKESFEKAYGALVSPAASAGYDLTLKINLDELKDQKVKDDLVTKLSMFKLYTLGGVFDSHFTNLLKGGAPTDPFRFSLRQDTEVFFFPKADRCTVIFSIDFKDRTDKVIARAFMQEFVDAKRALGAAPPVQFAVNPPAELAHFKISEPQKNLGFVVFPVLKAHVDKDKKEKVVTVLTTFRNYLQYHIKCSKSHFHARMRARVASLLQVLNRAKQEQPASAAQAAARTMSGKTFTRKV